MAAPNLDVLTQLRLAVAKAYWAVPPGSIRAFLDNEVTSEISPNELRQLLEQRFCEEEIRVSGVRDFIDAFTKLDKLLVPTPATTPVSTPGQKRAALADKPPYVASAPSTPISVPALAVVPSPSASSSSYLAPLVKTSSDDALPDLPVAATTKSNKRKPANPTAALKREDVLQLSMSGPGVRPAAAKALRTMHSHQHSDRDEIILSEITKKLQTPVAVGDLADGPAKKKRTSKAEAAPDPAAPALSVKSHPRNGGKRKVKNKRSERIEKRAVVEEDEDEDGEFDEYAESDDQDNYAGRSATRDWGKAEDEKLRQLVRVHGSKWAVIAQKMGKRFTGPQCAQHWRRVSRPGLERGPWSPEEEVILVNAMERTGAIVSSFAECSRLVKSRSDICCRYWWSHKITPSRERPFDRSEDDLLQRAADRAGGASLVLSQNQWKDLYNKARMSAKNHPNMKFRTPRDYIERLRWLTEGVAPLTSPVRSPRAGRCTAYLADS